MLGYAIDVSHHQNPDELPWETLYRGNVDVVIARAAYGAEYKDPATEAHMANARAIDAKVGAYLFYRPSQSWSAQAQTLEDVLSHVGYGDGDIVPALDIEADPLPELQNVTPAWSEPCRLLVEAIRTSFGECLIYITQREFHALGSPSWVLDRSLWVAHYTPASAPAMPGGDACDVAMWQHRVGPFVKGGQGGTFPGTSTNPQVDQSRILQPLPLVGGGVWTPPTPPLV